MDHPVLLDEIQVMQDRRTVASFIVDAQLQFKNQQFIDYYMK